MHFKSQFSDYVFEVEVKRFVPAYLDFLKKSHAFYLEVYPPSKDFPLVKELKSILENSVVQRMFPEFYPAQHFPSFYDLQ